MDGRHRKLTLDYVVLMGLLMTELLTSYLSYASPNGPGRIVVTSAGSEGAGMTLFMTCDGATPVTSEQAADFTAALETALVMDLLYELGAELRISSDHGLRAELTIVEMT
jgi:two-component sensor histidine kinase